MSTLETNKTCPKMYSNRNKDIFIVLPFFLIVVASCNKIGLNGDTNTRPVAGIYIAGDDGTNPILWVNGNATTLSSTGGSASQVTISGSGVYVAGVNGTGTSPNLTPAGPFGQYTYWKNGVIYPIGGLELLGP